MNKSTLLLAATLALASSGCEACLDLERFNEGAGGGGVGGDGSGAKGGKGGTGSGGSGAGDAQLGEPCEDGGDCHSGHCFDDVCCDSLCDGHCESCAKPSAGTCSFYGAGDDQDGDCLDKDESCSGLYPGCTHSWNDWSRQLGDGGTQEATDVVVLDNGEIVVVGTFEDQLDIKDHPVSIQAEDADGFVAKFEPNGNCVWSRKLGGSGAQEAVAVAFTVVDSDTMIYVAGNTDSGLTALPPWASDNNCPIITDSASAGMTGFVVALNLAGECRWIQSINGNNDQVISDITADPDTHVVVVGSFQEDLYVGDIHLSPNGGGDWDGFAAQLNLGTGIGGAYHIINSTSGTADQRVLASAVVDAAHVAVAGVYAGTNIHIGGDAHEEAADGDDAFVGVLPFPTSSGSLSFVFGGTDDENIRDVAVNDQGRIVVVGDFNGTLGLPGHTGQGGKDAFVATFTQNGNLEWAKSYGDADDQRAVGLTLDLNNDIIVTGAFEGELDVDGLLLQNHDGDRNVYMFRLDPDGVPRWSESFWGYGIDRGMAIDSDGNGNLIAVGAFHGHVQFGSELHETSSDQDQDGFVARFVPYEIK